MTQIKRIRKVLFTTAAFLIIAALFLQGCSSPSKMISDTTETAPGEAENTDDAKAVRKTEESGGDTGESEAAHTQDAAEQDKKAEEESADQPGQAGTEAETDAGSKAGTQAGTKAATDAGSNTGTQAETEAGTDAGTNDQAASEGGDLSSVIKEEPFENSDAKMIVVPRETFDSELDKLSSEYGTRDFYPSLLTWQGKTPAVDGPTGTVYIPCSDKDGTYPDWYTIVENLEPAARGEKIYFLEDDEMERVGDAVREGHFFEALLSSENGVSCFRVVLTGLPVMSIVKTDQAQVTGKELHTGHVTMIETTGLLQESDCTFHVRGNYASGYPKKPYKISLKKQNGKNNKISWLGMRKDDDWILNPFYTDTSRVREMTAYKVWEQVNALGQYSCPSSRIKYVEVFMDNTYHGIYGLTEPVDAKQLKQQRLQNQISFTENDILYKINTWDKDHPYLDAYPHSAGSIEISDNGRVCVEIRYPKEWIPGTTWDPMYLFHDFTIRTRDLEALSRQGVEVNKDSIVTLSLFCALTHATDNTWKNSLVIAQRIPVEQGDESVGTTASGERWMIYRDVWDLNYVFGDVFYASAADRYTAFSMDDVREYKARADSTFDYEALKAADPSQEGALAEKWAQWRDGGISAESVCGIADISYRELEQSGALSREMLCWPQSKDTGAALDEMKEWIRQRFDFLDEKFGYQPGTETGQ